MYKIFLLTAMILGLSACGGGSDNAGSNATEEFDFTALLVNMADTIILPTYETFEGDVASLEASIDAYCAAIDDASIAESSTELTARIAATEDWRTTMDTWQRAELYLFGPASTEGQLRNRILNIIADQQNFFNQAATDQAASDVTSLADYLLRAPNQQGLLALEYLLFTSGSEAAQVRSNRCRYAQFIAEDLVSIASEISADWSPDGGNFRTSFINPALVGDRVGLVANALFYIDLEVKDSRLGFPLGIIDSCPTQTCPDDIESPFSETTLENVRQNLLSFRSIFVGSEQTGFDDLYVFEGFADESASYIQDIDNAIAAVEDAIANGESVVNDVSNHDESACMSAVSSPEATTTLSSCAIYGLVEIIGDRFLSEFISIADTNIPARGQGDSD